MAHDDAMLDLDRALDVARAAARHAGAMLAEAHQGGGFTVDHKGAVDLLTDCDRRSEALIVGALANAFADHAILAEEGSAAGTAGSPLVWYVDPLDGTTNFVHGHPWYAVSIGLEDPRGPLLGVVNAPELGWELWAVRDRGAWLGEERLRVSRVAALDDALVATGFPYDRRTAQDNNVAEVGAVIRRCQGLRRFGVASLDCAAVAWGILDAYWEYKLKPWDLSAGAALVLEAGGRVTQPDGAPYTSGAGDILATNGRFHDELAAVLRTARPR